MTQKNNSTQSVSPDHPKPGLQLPPELLGEKEIVLLGEHLTYLKLTTMAAHYEVASLKANKESWPYVKYLAQLIELETQSRITVGRPVTQPPPYRSRRAELPHRALLNCSLRTCSTQKFLEIMTNSWLD